MSGIDAAAVAEAPLTEARVQDLIHAWCVRAKHPLTIPNCMMAWGYESDIASVTAAGLGHEFEVKISRSDWLSELRQIRDQVDGAKYHRAEQLRRAAEIVQALKAALRAGRTHAIVGEGYYRSPPPSYHWLATAPGIVRPEELPEYAGLMEVSSGPRGRVLKIVRKAPRLHSMKMDQRQIMALARGSCLRYWHLRKRVGQIPGGLPDADETDVCSPFASDEAQGRREPA